MPSTEVKSLEPAAKFSTNDPQGSLWRTRLRRLKWTVAVWIIIPVCLLALGVLVWALFVSAWLGPT